MIYALHHMEVLVDISLAGMEGLLTGCCGQVLGVTTSLHQSHGDDCGTEGACLSGIMS